MANAEQVREEIGHPIVDGDGHTVEFMPALAPLMAEEGVDLRGPSMQRTMSGSFGPPADWHAAEPAERTARRIARGPWAGSPSSATDMATSLLPSLLYERLDELGLDVSVVYPSFGLLFPHFEDETDRRGACRALNRFNAEIFAPFADRLITVASIPMHTPEEAIDELEHVASLGTKAIVMAGFVQRPADVLADDPVASAYGVWTDTFGLDSAYDYDPVWAKCVELGLCPSFHSGALGWQNRASTSSYVYNHVGMLGESNHAIAKSLFLGGVTRRFPQLNFGFMEGGVAWAASLFADLLGHWEKRNVAEMQRLDPAKADWDTVAELFAKYGGPWAEQAPKRRKGYRPTDAEMLDEFVACGIESAADIHELFVPRYYAGCEADDPMTAIAFASHMHPHGARFNAILGSDISHWDVPDMTDVVPEAWEMVEDGPLSAEDFRDFALVNPVRFYGRVNPGFFEGTMVADEAAALLAG